MSRFGETIAALKRWPTFSHWKLALAVMAATIVILWLLFDMAGLARWTPQTDLGFIVPTAAMLLVAPALLEELLFRGLLVGSGSSASAILSVAAFVAWHPLQAVTIGPPWAALFLDPAFLCGVALLGVALVFLRLRSGSLWPSIILHWLVVAGWKFLFGGPF